MTPEDLIKSFEGCQLSAYQDSRGRWTIGYGHTGDVKQGQVISQHQADILLIYDLEAAEEGVAHMTRGLNLTQNQVSALVSLSYNIGVTALANSRLIKLLLKGRVGEAGDEFDKWIHSGGKVIAGLVSRRAQEKALFLQSST